jgi:hypothetical protein
LANLQANNATSRLTLEYSEEGEGQFVRKAERQAHDKLSDYAVGNEWFSATKDVAIAVVREIMSGAKK